MNTRWIKKCLYVAVCPYGEEEDYNQIRKFTVELYIEACQSTLHLTSVCLHRLCKKKKRQKQAPACHKAGALHREHGSWSCQSHN